MSHTGYEFSHVATVVVLVVVMIVVDVLVVVAGDVVDEVVDEVLLVGGLTKKYPLAPIPVKIKSNRTTYKDEIPFDMI